MTTESHERWLIELTALPTASGREEHVIEWVTQWVGRRRNLALRRDDAGNMLIRPKGRGSGRPLFLTAHLDHPAFVVRRLIDERTVELEFRGSVHEPYFEKATIEIVNADHAIKRPPRATITSLDARARPYKRVVGRLAHPAAGISRGDVGRWVIRGRGSTSTVSDGLLYAPACDDLAGVAAALSTLDVLRSRRRISPVGVLLTRAEEVGFVGAIAACKAGTLPRSARVICLETSRSFPESPIGAGPILRVGDKTSVFSPDLTNRLGLLICEYQKRHPGFKAQRRLMPGGTCEATTFSAYGYEASCVCLPLGNYHNMVDIDGVGSGRRPAKVGPEYIALADYHGLVELLVHFVTNMDSPRLPDLAERMEEHLRVHAPVLGLRD